MRKVLICFEVYEQISCDGRDISQNVSSFAIAVRHIHFDYRAYRASRKPNRQCPRRRWKEVRRVGVLWQILVGLYLSLAVSMVFYSITTRTYFFSCETFYHGCLLGMIFSCWQHFVFRCIDPVTRQKESIREMTDLVSENHNSFTSFLAAPVTGMRQYFVAAAKPTPLQS